MGIDDIVSRAGDDAGSGDAAMPLLRALRLDAQGDWQGAHALVQEEAGPDAAWVHAYLHRKEGDTANAGYWYRRARRPVGTGDLDDERRAIAEALGARAGR